jgi:CheY-like chemotaxis protein
MIRMKRPVQVLLVQHNEEEVSNTKFALDKLELYYEFSWAKTAEEALAILSAKTHKKQVPDMVLIDYELPGADIGSLLKTIRERDQWKEFSCFLLVSPDTPVAMEPPDIPGLSGYISKPFSVSGTASSGSLKLVMDLINHSEYRRL